MGTNANNLEEMERVATSECGDASGVVIRQSKMVDRDPGAEEMAALDDPCYQ